MMQRWLTNAAILVGLLVALLAPTLATAQGTAGGGRPRASDEFIQLRVDRACADTEHSRMLANQLRMRLPETMVIAGEVETSGQWVVEWTPLPDGCVVNFETDENRSSMTLPANAELEQIELAASRIAFLASVASPASGASPAPALGVPGEELAEAASEAAPTAEEPSGPEPPDDNDGSEDEAGEVEAPPPPPEPEEEPSSDALDDAATENSAETPTEAKRPDYFEPKSQFFIVPGLSFPSSRPPGSAPRLAVGIIGTGSAALDGMAISSIFNIQPDYMKGLQLAGIFNVAGAVDGFQSAGVFNTASELDGSQLAGVFNYAGGGRLGLQLGGVANIHAGSFDGVQLASVVNVADDIGGVQVAAVTNIADDVDGLQLGLVNIGARIDGTQVGLVNIASESDFSFGLINVIFTEPVWFGAETSSDSYTLASLKHGSRYLKWSLWAGAPIISDSPVFLAGLGLGVHVPFGKFHVDFDLIGFDVTGTDQLQTNAGILEARLSAGWSFYERLAIVGGAGFRNFFSDGGDFGIVPGFASDFQGDPGANSAVAGWPHVFVGARF